MRAAAAAGGRWHVQGGAGDVAAGVRRQARTGWELAADPQHAELVDVVHELNRGGDLSVVDRRLLLLLCRCWRRRRGGVGGGARRVRSRRPCAPATCSRERLVCVVQGAGRRGARFATLLGGLVAGGRRTPHGRHSCTH